MGQATFYCDECGVRLKESDFQDGRAVRLENRVFCGECRAGVEEVEVVSPDEPADKAGQTGAEESSRPSPSSSQSSQKPKSSRAGSGGKRRKRGGPDKEKKTNKRVRGGSRSSRMGRYFLYGTLLLFVAGGAVAGFLFFSGSEEEESTDKSAETQKDQVIEDVESRFETDLTELESADLLELKYELEDLSEMEPVDYRQEDIQQLQTRFEDLNTAFDHYQSDTERLSEIKENLSESTGGEQLKSFQEALNQIAARASDHGYLSVVSDDLRSMARQTVQLRANLVLDQIPSLDTSSPEPFLSSLTERLDALQNARNTFEEPDLLSDLSGTVDNAFPSSWMEDNITGSVEEQIESTRDQVRQYVERKSGEIRSTVEENLEKSSRQMESGAFYSAKQTVNEAGSLLEEEVSPFVDFQHELISEEVLPGALTGLQNELEQEISLQKREIEQAQQEAARASEEESEETEEAGKDTAEGGDEEDDEDSSDESATSGGTDPDITGTKTPIFANGSWQMQHDWQAPDYGSLQIQEGSIVIQNENIDGEQQEPGHLLLTGRENWRDYTVRLRLEQMTANRLTLLLRWNQNAQERRVGGIRLPIPGNRMNNFPVVLTFRIRGNNLYQRTPDGQWEQLNDEPIGQEGAESGRIALSLLGEGRIVISRITAWVEQ